MAIKKSKTKEIIVNINIVMTEDFGKSEKEDKEYSGTATWGALVVAMCSLFVGVLGMAVNVFGRNPSWDPIVYILLAVAVIGSIVSFCIIIGMILKTQKNSFRR